MDSTLSIYYNSYILDIEVIQMEQNEKRHPKTCFFIGHRNAPESLRTRLNAMIEQLITRCGVTEFVVGHYGRFDAMCAGAVRDAKKRHQEISLVLLLPYYSPKGSKDFFTYYDETFYPPKLEQVPKRLAIVRANEYMIRHCDYLLCYCEGYIGNTRKIVEQAMDLEQNGLIKVYNIAHT